MATLAHLVLSLAAALALAGHPATAANRLTASRDAGRLLRLADLPPGARPLRSEPHGRLATPWTSPPLTNLVDGHRAWRVDSPVESVSAFLRSHPPRGSHFDRGELSPPMGLAFALPRTRRLYERELTVTLARLRDGSTGIRVDAQVVWTAEHPADEVVPGGVREIELRTAGSERRVSTPAKVRRIVRWFDALPPEQPARGVFACPAVLGPFVRIAFRGSGGTLLAAASFWADRGNSGFCDPIAFSIGGRRQKPLIGGRFWARVERLVRFRPQY